MPPPNEPPQAQWGKLTIGDKVQAFLTESMQLVDMEVMEALGEGTFGIVYRVKEQVNHGGQAQEYALKMAKSAKGVQQIAHEIAIMGRLNNPFIMSVVGVARHGTANGMLMPLCNSGNLDAVTGEQIDDSIIQLWLVETCLALRSLEEAGIIHRDIKQPNIVMEDFLHLKLADFGIATTNGPNLTNAGTPGYQAPEVLAKHPVYSCKADMWSLGKTIFEVAMGPSFTGHQPQVASLHKAILDGNAKDYPLTCSAELKTILLSMLENDEAKRPSADELLRHPLLRRSLTEVLKVFPQLEALVPGVLTAAVAPAEGSCKRAESEPAAAQVTTGAESTEQPDVPSSKRAKREQSPAADMVVDRPEPTWRRKANEPTRQRRREAKQRRSKRSARNGNGQASRGSPIWSASSAVISYDQQCNPVIGSWVSCINTGPGSSSLASMVSTPAGSGLMGAVRRLSYGQLTTGSAINRSGQLESHLSPADDSLIMTESDICSSGLLSTLLSPQYSHVTAESAAAAADLLGTARRLTFSHVTGDGAVSKSGLLGALPSPQYSHVTAESAAAAADLLGTAGRLTFSHVTGDGAVSNSGLLGTLPSPQYSHVTAESAAAAADLLGSAGRLTFSHVTGDGAVSNSGLLGTLPSPQYSHVTAESAAAAADLLGSPFPLFCGLLIAGSGPAVFISSL